MDTPQPINSTPSVSPMSPAVAKPTGLVLATAILGVLVVVLAGTTFFFLDKMNAAKKEVAELQQENRNLEALLDDAEGLEDDVVAAQATNSYIADKLDELETILLDTDSNSVNFITWVFDNAYFDDVDLAQAKYDAWEAEQYRTNDAYDAWKAEVGAYFGEDSYEETEDPEFST